MALNLLLRPTSETDFSPVYAAHQRDYNERYAIHEQNARRWRATSFGCIAIAMISVVGLCYAAAQNKYVPYVVERDQLGDQVAIGLAERAAQPDVRVIQSAVRTWIHNVRTVSVDAGIEHYMVWDAYYHTNKSSPASGELDKWFGENSPFKRATETIVNVSKINALPTDPQSWKLWHVSWTEEVMTRTGDRESLENKEASVTVSYRPPATDNDFAKNASGVFISNFTWIK